jgi:hypothetical protein
MKTRLALTSLALAFTVGACSEDRLTNANSTPVDQPQDQVGQITTGNLIAALNNVNVEIGELNALNDLTIGDINIVNVEDVLNNARILNNSRFLNRIRILQDFLNNSLNNNNVEILNDVLNNNNIAISDVVAIDVLSGGDVNVFVQGQ